MDLALWQSDIGSLINGILSNDTWTRVLMLGAICYGLIELRAIKRTMVTQESLKYLLLEMRREIDRENEQRFLTKSEHATICKPIEQGLLGLTKRLERHEERSED